MVNRTIIIILICIIIIHRAPAPGCRPRESAPRSSSSPQPTARGRPRTAPFGEARSPGRLSRRDPAHSRALDSIGDLPSRGEGPKKMQATPRSTRPEGS